MITPSPTTRIDSGLARGTLQAVTGATGTKPGYITFAVPNTSYELHLIPTGPVATAVGKRILGTIHAKARRIDVVDTGGRYVEPVYGRPRRVQGTVLSVTATEVVVDAGVPIHVTPTDERQAPGDFKAGEFVSFDVMDGATFVGRA